MSSRTSVLVADDEALIAHDIARVVRADGFDVVGIVTDPSRFLAHLVRTRPALAIVDVRFGETDGIELVTSARVPFRPRVLYVSAYTDGETVDRAVRADCAGFLSKPFTDQQLAAGVRVSLGRLVKEPLGALTPEPPHPDPARTLARIAELVRDWSPSRPAEAAVELPCDCELTAREREVVSAVMRHLRIARVARSLHISHHTVRNHLRSIYSKLDVHSVDELLEYVRAGGGAAPSKRG